MLMCRWTTANIPTSRNRNQLLQPPVISCSSFVAWKFRTRYTENEFRESKSYTRIQSGFWISAPTIRLIICVLPQFLWIGTCSGFAMAFVEYWNWKMNRKVKRYSSGIHIGPFKRLKSSKIRRPQNIPRIFADSSIIFFNFVTAWWTRPQVRNQSDYLIHDWPSK